MQQNNVPLYFSYTGQRSMYITFVGSLSFMLIVESVVLAIILHVTLANSLLSWIINVGHLLLCIVLLVMLLLPFWTQHCATSHYLYLHFGMMLKLGIPREEIASIERLERRQALATATVGAFYQAKKQQLVVCFSSQHMLHIKLRCPFIYQSGLLKRSITSILLNVDRPDEFMATLQPASDPVMDTPQVDVIPISLATIQPLSTILSQSTALSVDRQRGQNAIRVEHLARRFDQIEVVRGISMLIKRGEIYGLLGSNGAGKTTLIKMLVGLLQPTGGKVWLLGKELWRDSEDQVAKASLGYVPDQALLYERLTGREYLMFLAALRGLSRDEADKRIAYWLDLLDLTYASDRVCGSYSLGMKRKLSLAGALLHQPQILILDEPLNGLDPHSTRRLKDLFIQLADEGITVLLSTHDLAIAEEICHRVGIVHQGQLVAEGSTQELLQLVSVPDLEAVFLNITANVRQPALNGEFAI